MIRFTATDKENRAKEEATIKIAYAKRLERDGYAKAGPVPVTDVEFVLVYGNGGDARLKPGEALPVANAELFQSINPFWVIVLTPLLVAIWRTLRRKRQEPTTS